VVEGLVKWNKNIAVYQIKFNLSAAAKFTLQYILRYKTKLN